VSLTVSVVVCAYTAERWDLIKDAIASLQAQTRPPIETVLCIDHNPMLSEQCRQQWPAEQYPDLAIVDNRYDGRLGSARNTACELVRGDIIAFLDDDARAAPDWLANLSRSYESDASAMAIGGAPLPIYGAARPAWLPDEFNWVFGCAYRGLPSHRAPVRHLIGANMSVRRSALVRLGGFHSDNHDDMDLCHRVARVYGQQAVVYDPTVRVDHYVSANRLTWDYFWRRCFYVNRGKVVAFKDMEAAGNIMAEIRFGLRSLFISAPRYVAHLRPAGFMKGGAVVVGLALAAAGHLSGRVQLALGTATPSLTHGFRPRYGVAE